MRKIFYATLSVFLLLIGNNLFGQGSITGPTCVVPGVTYTYNISAIWDSLSTMRVCVTGGVIADSTDTTCTPHEIPVKAVTVIWDTTSSGSVTLTSSLGNSTLNITITSQLIGGFLDTTIRTQMVAINSIPAVIHCSAATGGSCSPSYSYQWQQSKDNVNWIDIDASGTDLSIDSALTESKYYRRRVIETTSESVGYSDVAAVFVGISGLHRVFRIEPLYCILQTTLYRGRNKIKLAKIGKTNSNG